MKVLITGGHITPALALIDELKKNKDNEVVIVGRRYSTKNNVNPSFEYETLRAKGIRFIHLDAGRLTRTFSSESISHVWQIIPGFIKAFSIVSKEKPDVIMSFGGYIALPIAFAGFIMGISVFTHEQTLVPGLTTTILAYFARRVFMSFPETLHQFGKKAILSGNPVRSEVFETINNPIKPGKRKGIYITGGSLGSHSVNLLVEQIIDELTYDFEVIHQTGDSGLGDYERLERKAKRNHHYHVFKHVYADEIGSIFSESDMVVSRSGANTVFELIALKKPSILIPLPWSARGEQEAQARFLENAGVAKIFKQDKSAADFLNAIEEMMDNLDYYKKNFSQISSYYKPDAAAIIAKVLYEYCA